VSQRTEGATVRFDATLSTIGTSAVVRLPETASRNLPSRGQVAVHGTINGVEFQTVLEPDGNSGHWMRVDDTLRRAAGISAGDTAALDIEVTKDWPEPGVPPDLATALATAPPKIQVDRPGDLGGSDSWKDAESCLHSGSTPMSCANAR
jgi:Domain of unknown function (DUF1905)